MTTEIEKPEVIEEDVKEYAKYILPKNAYQFLKWLALIAIPIIGVSYAALAPIWGLAYGGEVLQTSAVLEGLLGVLIGVSAIKGGIDG
jgi:hypothetical protein